ncbi:MAG: hypothetical protein ACKVKL_09395 [Pseudomonadales bacterium]|jgi:hypothetical protein
MGNPDRVRLLADIGVRIDISKLIERMGAFEDGVSHRRIVKTSTFRMNSDAPTPYRF